MGIFRSRSSFDDPAEVVPTRQPLNIQGCLTQSQDLICLKPIRLFRPSEEQKLRHQGLKSTAPSVLRDPINCSGPPAMNPSNVSLHQSSLLGQKIFQSVIPDDDGTEIYPHDSASNWGVIEDGTDSFVTIPLPRRSIFFN